MWFLISGILFGTIAGMGMGGGIILIPVLTVFLGVDQQGAQGLNLLCFLPMAGFALFSHIKHKQISNMINKKKSKANQSCCNPEK